MELDIVQPVKLSVGILKLFGLWRLDSEYNFLYRIYTYLLNIITTFSTTISMWTCVIKAKNLEEFTESLFMALTMLALSVKVINILHLNTLAVNFLKQLEGKDFRLKSPKEIKKFKNSLRMFYFVAIIYTCASFTVFIFGFSIVAFGSKWVLPYPTWLPFEYRYESKYFWMAYSYQFVGLFVACLSNVSLDILQCYFLKSISLIYFVIGSCLAYIGNGIENVSIDSFEVNKIIVDELKEIIQVHNFAKKLTVDCERLLSVPIFIQVLLSAFVLCFTGYQLSSMSISDSPGQFIAMIDFLFVMGLQIYLPCHYGNQLTLEAGNLCEALYSSNWTVLPQKSKKTIFLYMEFLKEPIYVKAGKFFQIGIPTFAKTVNNAYSFFAVLIRMKN